MNVGPLPPHVDIARALAGRDGLTFRSSGTCMYPALRPGDVLRIRPCSAAETDPGDIAVCRTPDYLFSHRVVRRGERDGRAFIVTRADRSLAQDDDPTLDVDLIGVVERIERRGRTVPLRAAVHGRLRVYYDARLRLIELRSSLRAGLERRIDRLQRLPAYSWAARRWYAHRRPRLRFVVRVPAFESLGDAVSRELEPRSFDPSEPWQGREIHRWTIVAVGGDTRRPGASATFVDDDACGWRLEESSVRIRYRGSGLREALLREAERIIERTGRGRAA